MKNDVRMEIRLPKEQRDTIDLMAKKTGTDRSDFVRAATEEKIKQESSLHITNTKLLIDAVRNITLAFPRLNQDYKNALEKELQKYE